jgi:hypothetical protein
MRAPDFPTIRFGSLDWDGSNALNPRGLGTESPEMVLSVAPFFFLLAHLFPLFRRNHISAFIICMSQSRSRVPQSQDSLKG